MYANRGLDDELRLCAQLDPQYLAHNAYRAALEVNIRNSQSADLAKPQAAVDREPDPHVLMIG